MFERLFIEREILDHPRTQKFLDHFPNTSTQVIEDVDQVFNRVKKPYLQKREHLQGFLAKKRGTLIKEAPEAYGLAGEPHYYFIHSYNCIYECQYCYLQGYFHSPDLVFFLNYEEMIDDMERLLGQHPDHSVWFHAGEFSDSLALSHLTGEVPLYHSFLERNPRALIELRTKSVNIKPLLALAPNPQLITSFSLSTQDQVRAYDLKTPGLKARLQAIKKLDEQGHPVALHLDPIVFSHNFEEQFKTLFQQITDVIAPSRVRYMSLGVVRFTKDVYHQVEKNYPDSPLLKTNMQKSFDGKIRYSRPMRLWMLNKVKQLALSSGFQEQQIYLCMEQEDRLD